MTTDQPADEVPTDRRRLRRAVSWQHPGQGLYSTSDSMHAVRKVASRKWERGVRQPYHDDDAWDFTNADQFGSLRDAQTHVEANEAERPRISTQQTIFHDRRGY